jgi:plastocyanin
VRWLYSAVVGAGLVLAVAAITTGEAQAQAIRPQPVYPSAPPNYAFAPGQNYYPPTATLYGGTYPSMPYGGSYPSMPYRGMSGSYGPTASMYGSAGMSSSAPAFVPPSPPAVDAALYNNSFIPSVLYVSAGTVVRWTNRGRHPHTVTSDEGFWDSGELRPGEGYAVFFPLGRF